jgi:signal transduction histidine kinase/ketosteroid isomerase-like protein
MKTDLGALSARYHRAFNNRDFDVWREVFAEDVELVIDGTTFRGVDAAVGYGVGSVSQFPGLFIGSERLVAESGDTMVTEIEIVNGDPASGRSRRQGTTCEICRVHEGRIVSCRSYYMAEAGGGEDAVRVPIRAEAARIAEEQAALRHVATRVAEGISQEKLFAAVTEEMGWLVAADATSLLRFEPDDTVTLVAAWSADHSAFPIGSKRPLNEELRRVRDAGRSWRWGPAELPVSGPFVEEGRRLGVRAAVGVPIVLDGRAWGIAFASSTADEPFSADAEMRIADFTELVAIAIANAESRSDARLLADEQAALRRVATLVARESVAEEIFAAVAEEIGRVLGLDDARMVRDEGDGTATVVASWGQLASALPVGTRIPLEGLSAIALALRTGRPARIDDFTYVPGRFAAAQRRLGVRSAVGAPIVVEGRLWGAISTASLKPDPIPPDTESRMGDFTELVATAISNIKARSDLAASRARIAAAADAERRRVVRDLHDGAQQRLVHTVVTLKLAQDAIPPDQAPASALVAEARDHAQRATDELRELAHGILPTALTAGGLRAGVEALASGMPLPIDADVPVERLPAAIEATAYFVVAEALTNVAKHARAERARVSARIEDGVLRVEVRDDGVGGARADGSGLLGLGDRLAVLDGRLRVESRPGSGTRVAADIPLAAGVPL